jgi:hypothetical protein
MSRITTAIHGANIIHENAFVKRGGKFFNEGEKREQRTEKK